jgi:hypothetical protein
MSRAIVIPTEQRDEESQALAGAVKFEIPRRVAPSG